ncbi:MAG: M36 family metallopeptidase [Chitinophagaceae bacterium]|nr:M36 family metallopeptidase [Chitinophagaceae bacterium]
MIWRIHCGFDEVAGNFQNDNQGRGGAGVDYVMTDAGCQWYEQCQFCHTC